MGASANKRFRSSILKALASYENTARGIEEGKALDAIGMEVVKCAVDRKDPEFMNAVNIIANRLDGKPTEHIEVNDSEGAAAAALGISAAFALLVQTTGQGKIIDGEVVMPDGSVLPSQIRPEPDGRRERVGIPADTGSPERPE